MHRERGFLLPIVAVLLAAAAALVVDGLRGATLDQALTAAMRDRQRGFEAAEMGLAHAEVTLRTPGPAASSQTVGVDALSRAIVTIETVERDPLPEGFSSGRVVAERMRVRSVGETTRGTRLTLELGLTRLQSAP